MRSREQLWPDSAPLQKENEQKMEEGERNVPRWEITQIINYNERGSCTVTALHFPTLSKDIVILFRSQIKEIILSVNYISHSLSEGPED